MDILRVSGSCYRSLSGYFVDFVALVGLVRNATVRHRTQTNDRFLTKNTKIIKITTIPIHLRNLILHSLSRIFQL